MTLIRHSIKRGRVEIVPMIDTILILLIFYMSFSTFRGEEKQLEVPLPNPIGGVPGLQIELQVRETGDLLVNGVAYEPALLRQLLTTLGATDPRTAVNITAERETKYQAVISALDLCAQAKLRNVAFRPVNG